MAPSALSRSVRTVAVLGAAIASTFGGQVSAASAQGCIGRPGTSAVEQYCESVPQGDGGREKPSSNGAPAGSTDRERSGVDSATAESLRREGADGEALAAFAGAGAGGSGTDNSPSGDTGGANPKSTASGENGDDATSGRTTEPSAAAPKDSSASPLRAATQAAQTGPAAGSALVWVLLGLSVLGILAAIVVRQRGNGAGTNGTGPSS